MRENEVRSGVLAARLQEGDLIFHTSQSRQSEAIQLATHSPYSHVGVVFKAADGWRVFEAEGRVVSTPLKAWIARGKERRCSVKRYENLKAGDARRLKNAAERFLGKGYDPYFEWSDDRIYCSELVWKIYRRALGVELCPLKRLKTFDLTATPMKAKLRERFGAAIPLQEPVVSPADLYVSELLIDVGIP